MEPTPVSRAQRRGPTSHAAIAADRQLRCSSCHTLPPFGTGRIGPPFLHDWRVHLNPAAPATTLTSSADGGVTRPLVITTVEEAILAAIELHDLPPPEPGCPQPGS